MYPADLDPQAHTEKLASGHRVMAHLVANGEDPLAFVELVKVANTDPRDLAFADDVAYALVHALQHDAVAGQKVAGIMAKVRGWASTPLSGFLAGIDSSQRPNPRGFLNDVGEALVNLPTIMKTYGPVSTALAIPSTALGLAAGYHPVAATGAGIAGLGALAAGGAVAHRKYDEAHPFGATMRNFGF